MRDSERQKQFRPTDQNEAEGAREVPFDGKAFFESFYAANVTGNPVDHMTIGWITEAEAAFHYNAVENSIIRAILQRTPPPANAMVQAWRMVMQRQQPRLLDIGSGTGHWIDFMRDTFYTHESVGIEITEKMTEFLRTKYANDPNVSILTHDVSNADFTPELIGGPVDYITAIGVMFHIVDDAKWSTALTNLSRCLKPNGLLLVGEEAGHKTQNREFHNSDRFNSWSEFKRAEATPGEVRVNKRVRSLSDWISTAASAGLRLIDVIRSDRASFITTPENDLLVFGSSGRATAR